MTFKEIIELLREGHNCYRLKWMGEDLMPSFITMQIPSTIPYNVIPKMTSLQTDTKDSLTKNGVELRYNNQVLGIKIKRGVANATYYIPTWEDIFADDWATTI